MLRLQYFHILVYKIIITKLKQYFCKAIKASVINYNIRERIFMHLKVIKYFILYAVKL